MYTHIKDCLAPIQILKMVQFILNEGKSSSIIKDLNEFFFNINIERILTNMGVNSTTSIKTMQILSFAILKQYKQDQILTVELLYNLFVSTFLERIDSIIKRWQYAKDNRSERYLGLFADQIGPTKLLHYVVDKEGKERIKVVYTYGKPPQINANEEELRKFVIECLRDEYSYENIQKSSK